MDLLLETYIKKRRLGIPRSFIFQNPDLLVLNNYYNIITHSCDRGDIEILKHVFRNYGIDLSTNNHYVFRHSCRNPYLQVTEMLYDNTIKQKELNLAFAWACECGHYDTALWLYDKSVDIHTGDDRAFKWSCINGHLAIAKWLHSIDDTLMINAFIKNFTHACKHYDVEIWLYSLKLKNTQLK